MEFSVPPPGFSANLVAITHNKWTRWLIGTVGVLIAGLFLAYYIHAYTIVTILFSACALMVVVGAVVLKGNIQLYEVSNDKMTITPDAITIKEITYDIKKIKALTFTVHSYAGMDYMVRGTGLSTSDGMNNLISFSYEGAKISHNFYLISAMHVTALAIVFKEWYVRHIPFIEKDMAGYQTYLLQRLSDKELQEFKVKYGYTKT